MNLKKLLPLTVFFLLFGFTHHASAAVAFQQVASSTNNAATVTYHNFAVTGTNPITIVCVNENNGTDDISSVTFNGSAKTQQAKLFNSSSIWMYMYSFTGQSGVTADITATFGSASNHRMNITQYTGANQSPVYSGVGQTDATSTKTSPGVSSIANSVTTIQDNSWVYTCLDNDAANGTTASTNVTRRITDSASVPVLASGDTNAVVTPAGSLSQTWTSSAGGNLGMFQLTISPVAAAAATSNPILGLVRAFFLGR